MYQLHPANRRGRTYTGWLDSYHTFPSEAITIPAI